MAAVEAAIAKIFIDVAVSVGVDVLSKRSVSPVIRGASKTYKVFSLISTVEGAYGAIRICAYTDALRLIGQEAFIEIGSKPIASALLRIREANYEVHREAERYLLTPEYAEALKSDEPLVRWLYVNHNFLADNLTGFGEPLAAQTSACVARAARACAIARELSDHAEARIARRYYNFDRAENWTDRVNSGLGHLLWQPVPEIGLGMRVVADDATYFGIFRRNDPEGYGCIVRASGTRYFGQTRWGFPSGYGALHFPDGSFYFGKAPTGDHLLGATISPNRDWVYYGEHRGTVPDGYGRRVGLANGVESVTAFWQDGAVESVLETLVEVHRNIAARMEGPPLAELRRDYERQANEAERMIRINDASVLSHISGYL